MYTRMHLQFLIHAGASPHVKEDIDVTMNYVPCLYINATGAVCSAGSWSLHFLLLIAALTFGTDKLVVSLKVRSEVKFGRVALAGGVIVCQ
jgi:hypothetical protein